MPFGTRTLNDGRKIPEVCMTNRISEGRDDGHDGRNGRNGHSGHIVVMIVEIMSDTELQMFCSFGKDWLRDVEDSSG